MPPLLLSCPPKPPYPSFKEMAPAIDWLSCLQATFAPMSLSPSHPVAVHDLEYLKNMSQLVEKQLSKHRFAPRGRVMERGSEDRRSQGQRRLENAG